MCLPVESNWWLHCTPILNYPHFPFQYPYSDFISGVPKLRETIRDRTEVEQVRLSEHVLAILYQSGLVRAYKIPVGFLADKSTSLELLLQFRVWGLPTPHIQNEYTLFSQEILDIQTVTPTESIMQQAEDAALTSSTNLEVNHQETPVGGTTEQLEQDFLTDPWFDTEYLAADMIFLITENYLVISGYACNCFLIFGFETKDLVKKVQVPLGVQACRNVRDALGGLFFGKVA